MAENYFQDVVPKSGQRSIRNIPLPESRTRTRSRTMPPPVREEDTEAEAPKPPREKRTPRSGGKPFNWRDWKKTIVSCALIFIVIMGFVVSSVFHSAKVITRVKTAKISIIEDTFTAKKMAGVLEMSFEPLIVKKVGEAVTKSTGEEQVDERASGTIVIFNNHNSSPQRLIKNTRFESSKGLIYRIDQSVVVPGKTGSVPGSVEVAMYADEPGEKFNSGLEDFTIPGFKGDPRYETFFARSKTPTTGGFSGVMKVVSAEDKKKADSEIISKTTNELIAEAVSKVPEGFVFYPNLYKIEWSDLPQEAMGGDEVKMKKEATLTAVTFNKDTLASFLAHKHIDDYKGDNVKLNDFNTLTVAPAKPDSFDPKKDSVDISLSGDALFVWQFDEGALKSDLAGRSKEELPSILTNFNSSIVETTPSFSPFWIKSFPENVEKIDIEIVLE